MNNSFDNDEDLDQWLRQQEAVNTGSDTPSEQVWERIRTARQERRRRRRFIFWVLLFGLTGSMLWLLLTRLPSSPRPNTPTQHPVADTRQNSPANAGVPAPEKEPEAARIGSGSTGGIQPDVLRATVPPAPRIAPKIDILVGSNTRPETTSTLPVLPVVARPYDELRRLPALRTSLSWERSLPNPAFPITPASVQPVTKSCPDLELGLVAGPVYTARRSPAGNNNTGSTTWQGGLHAGIRIGHKWTLESGLQWNDMRLVSSRTGVFTYAIQSEQYNADRQWFENSSTEHLETGLGDVDLRYDIGWSGNRPLFDRERFRVRFDLEERLQYLRIPAGLGYQYGHGRWQWRLQGGMGFNLKLGYELEIRDFNTDRLGIRQLQARTSGREDALNPAFVDLYASIGVRYQLPSGLSLQLGPTVRYGMSPLAGATKNRSVGAQLALIYTCRTCNTTNKHSLNYK